jgi:hypothetical protein
MPGPFSIDPNYDRISSIALWTDAVVLAEPLVDHDLSLLGGSKPLVFNTPYASRVRRRRNAFPTTETEDRLIAAAANTGEINMPKKGYKIPAATGTPKAL